MIEIPNPNKNEVEKYLKKWDSLENYVLQENSLDKLFFYTYPYNIDINRNFIIIEMKAKFYNSHCKILSFVI